MITLIQKLKFYIFGNSRKKYKNRRKKKHIKKRYRRPRVKYKPVRNLRAYAKRNGYRHVRGNTYLDGHDNTVKLILKRGRVIEIMIEESW